MVQPTLRDAFPDGLFQPAASPDEIAWAEAQLDVVIPGPLRSLYMQSNGFREPRGHAQYLTPLTEMVVDTRFLWSEIAASIPEVDFPDFQPFLFFGTSAAAHWWGIRREPPHDVIAWHHNMLEEDFDYEIAGANIIAVYKADQAMYDELD